MRHSIFVRLITIMLSMALSILLLVGGFFALLVAPNLTTALERIVGEYSRLVSQNAPDLEAAKAMAARQGFELRYEGPAGAWSTSAGLPSISAVRAGNAAPWTLGRDCHLVPAPDGGTYLFAWTFHRRLGEAHDRLLWLLLGLIVSVVLLAHAVLRGMLRPLRSLQQGVVRLGGGDLDVVLPEETRDEFGALTSAFNQMVQRIKEMIHARDQLLVDVSHELRSPLTRMKVALALLPDGEKKDRMSADVAEMETMVAQLLEHERLRDGRGVHAEAQDLLPILREAVAPFRDRGPGARVVVNATALPVIVDADRVRTVLRNLLDNAAKFSLPDSGAIQVQAEPSGESVIVRIVDDGPGIPESDLARVFEPFFRVDRSRSRRTGGFGLGLSMCQRIMEAHGGSIQVENNPGRGATFTLVFPRRP
jgi:signal transduction histidine kinase